MKAASRIIFLPILLAIACLGFVYPAGAVEAAEAPSADIAISGMTGAPDPVDVGDELTYTITVTNMGPDGMDAIAVSDTLPAGVEFVSASTSNEGACANDNGLVECGLGRLEVDDVVTVTIVVSPTESGNIENSATVDILSGVASLDPDISNNTASVTTEVIDPVPTADLAITSMTDEPDPVTVGEELTYTIRVSNHGSATVDSILSSTLPEQVEFLSGDCDHAEGVVTCRLGLLEADANAIITIKVRPLAAGTITNSATVEIFGGIEPASTGFGGVVDPDPSNNTAIVETEVLPSPSGEITILGPVALNRQTGLLEQGVRFTNLADGTLPSVRLNITDLPEDVAVYNLSGEDEHGVYVEAFGDVTTNASVDFLVEFLRASREIFDDPTYTIGLLNEVPPANVQPSGTELEITRKVLTGDGSLLIEFTSVPGYLYTIQYRSDLEDEEEEWKNAVPVIQAVADRTQWLDDGPPKTESRISETSRRFYRVIERLH